MQLRFIGIGAAFNPGMGSTSAFFIRGSELFLLDCGEQTFARLVRADMLTKDLEGICVFLTHLHADHSGSLASLCLYADTVLGCPMTVVYPHAEISILLSIMGVRQHQYTLLDAYAKDGLTAVPTPTVHAPSIRAYAYELTDEDGAIYYSGDSAVLSGRVVEEIGDGVIRHAYVDVNLYEGQPDRSPHLPYATLCAQVPSALRDRFTLMHLNRDFRMQAEADGFRCAAVDEIFAG